MCGITGVWSPQNADVKAFFLSGKLAHRGPHMTGLGVDRDGGIVEKWVGRAYERPNELCLINYTLFKLLDNFFDEIEQLRKKREQAGFDFNPLRELMKMKNINWMNEIDLVEGKSRSLNTDMAIAHDRYYTQGSYNLSYAHPQTDYLREVDGPNFRIEKFCTHQFVFNGNVETSEYKKLVIPDFNYDNNGDTRIMAEFCREYGAEKLVETADFAYAFIDMNDLLEFARGPHGFRFLSYAKLKDGTIAISSESRALDMTGFPVMSIRHIAPGSVGTIDDGKLRIKKVRKLKYTPCSFEFDYFGRPKSHLDGLSIKLVRSNMGKIMSGYLQPSNDSIVTYLPRSPFFQAKAFADRVGFGLNEIYQVRGYDRSFLAKTTLERRKTAKQKLQLSEEGRRIIKNTHVYLLDDSIVRGNTSGVKVRELKDAGAQKVTMVITSPPVVDTCNFGIYIPTRRELIAYRCAEELGYCSRGEPLDLKYVYNQKYVSQISEKVAHEIGANKVFYMPLSRREDLFKGYTGAHGSMCNSCMKCFGRPLDFDLK